MGAVRTTLVTAIAPLTWGTTYAVTTLALPVGHPWWAAALRALPAGLLLVGLGRRLPRGLWWWRALVLGVLNIGAFFPLLFIAAYRLPGGLAATLGACSPLIVALLAMPLLHERPGAWRLVWGVLGVVGVGLMVLRSTARLDTIGLVAGLAGMVSMAAGTVLTKRWGNPTTPIAFAGWQLTGGGLVLVPAALILEPFPWPLTGQAALGYLWLGLVGGALAYVLWFRGVGHLPVTAVAFLPLLSPAVATLIGVLALGERLGAWQWLGFAVALTSVAAGQLGGSRRTRKSDGGDRRTAGGSGRARGEARREVRCGGVRG